MNDDERGTMSLEGWKWIGDRSLAVLMLVGIYFIFQSVGKDWVDVQKSMVENSKTVHKDMASKINEFLGSINEALESFRKTTVAFSGITQNREVIDTLTRRIDYMEINHARADKEISELLKSMNNQIIQLRNSSCD